MKINERIKKMSKRKKILLATVLAITFVVVSIVLFNYTFRIAGMMIAKRTNFILFTKEITGILFGAGLLSVFYGILMFIFSRNKIDSIKDLTMDVYNALEAFTVLTAGMITDLLLIIFACMNFNKIVVMSSTVPGANTGIASTGLAIGILALGIRSMIRPIKYFNMDYYIRKFLNTNEDIEYE